VAPTPRKPRARGAGVRARSQCSAVFESTGGREGGGGAVSCVFNAISSEASSPADRAVFIDPWLRPHLRERPLSPSCLGRPSIGGFVAMDAKYKTLLTWNARPYLFQACFTPADAAAILAALDEVEHAPAHARRLHENNAFFRALLKDAGFDLRTSQSPVVPVYLE
jgi:hypothetical protein